MQDGKTAIYVSITSFAFSIFSPRVNQSENGGMLRGRRQNTCTFYRTGEREASQVCTSGFQGDMRLSLCDVNA